MKSVGLHIQRSTRVVTAVVILSVCIILVAVLVDVAAGNAVSTLHQNSEIKSRKTVIIDPGHGGEDGGAVGIDGTIEKGINLSISLKLRDFFRAAGYTVIMTREDDRAIYDSGCDTLRKKKSSDLHNRLNIVKANPYALFLSIHQNIYTNSIYSGAQVFYSPNDPSSKLLAESIQQAVKSNIQPQNERVVKPAGDNLYILYNAKSVAVMAECGFLSNLQECKMLEDDDYQNKMAFSVFSGTLQYYASIE